MIYLADTNVLLRLVMRADPQHDAVWKAWRALRADRHELWTTSQNFAEFWAVSTRQVQQNGYGHTPAGSNRLLRIAERIVFLLPESPNAYVQWRRLVVQYGVSGVQTHDARLAASIIAHGTTHILTFNTSDFTRFAPEGIVAVDPANV